MTDIIKELSEEMKQEKIENFVLKNLKNFIYLAIAILLGVAASQVYYSQIRNERLEKSNLLIQAIKDNGELSADDTQKLYGLDSVENYIARLYTASIDASKGQYTEAIQKLEYFISNPTNDKIMQSKALLDLAIYKSIILVDKGEANELEYNKIANEFEALLNSDNIFKTKIQESYLYFIATYIDLLKTNSSDKIASKRDKLNEIANALLTATDSPDSVKYRVEIIKNYINS